MTNLAIPRVAGPGIVYPLSAESRSQILAHLLRLPLEDRRLRFGVAIPEETVARYVEGLDFSRDAIFGVREDSQTLIGFTHVASLEHAVELGLSVDVEHRGRGIARALFRRAKLHARNRGYRHLYMHCLAENAAMLHLAREAGMRIVIDGSDRDAALSLPPATALSVGAEYYEGQLVLLDWALRTAVAHTTH